MIKVDTWHPINGEWVHICQEFRGECGHTMYYTNGKLVGQENATNFGKVLKPITKPTVKHEDFDKHDRI